MTSASMASPTSMACEMISTPGDRWVSTNAENARGIVLKSCETSTLLVRGFPRYLQVGKAVQLGNSGALKVCSGFPAHHAVDDCAL